MPNEPASSRAQALLAFWFDEVGPARWWRADPALDAQIAERFGALHAAACACELEGWRASPAGRLAEVILLDQLSRNLYRDSARAFAQDGLALALAQEAIRAGADRALSPAQRHLLYMPFMHSESALMQRRSMALFSAPGLEPQLEHAQRHKAVVERFGRYPQRNAALGRRSTVAERRYLAEPGSRF